MINENELAVLLLVAAGGTMVALYRAMSWLTKRWERKETKQWIRIVVSLSLMLLLVSTIVNLIISAFDILFFSHL